MTNVEESLVNDKELRNSLSERIEVLDKVKTLLLIPNLEVLTAKQVAEYYEVPVETVKSCYKYNKEEIDSDGTNVKSLSSLKVEFKPLEIQQGKTILKVSEDISIEVPNRGVLCFPRRAILRIGMLLRDSEVAKEVRTQLLNIEEQVTLETKISSINEEEQLLLEVGKAYASGDANKIMLATTNYVGFQNRHIEKLETHNTYLQNSNSELLQTNKALAEGILEWTDRACLNKAIRIMAGACGNSIARQWNILYDELLYKYHISVKKRGNSPFIQHIKEDEWKNVVKILASICEDNDLSFSTIIKTAKLDKKEYSSIANLLEN